MSANQFEDTQNYVAGLLTTCIFALFVDNRSGHPFKQFATIGEFLFLSDAFYPGNVGDTIHSSNIMSMTREEVEKRLPELGTGWEYCEKHTAIEKDFDRGNFLKSVDFIGQIAPLAEGMDHHPDLLLHGYKFVKVILSTHDAKSVTNNDFTLAKKIEAIQ